MSENKNVIAKRVVISGLVQGVFYRSSLRRVAEESHLVGWVRNLPDGTVEALLQGTKEDVDRVVEWCRVGPRRSRVESLSVQELQPNNSYRNFAILY